MKTLSEKQPTTSGRTPDARRVRTKNSGWWRLNSWTAANAAARSLLPQNRLPANLLPRKKQPRKKPLKSKFDSGHFRAKKPLVKERFLFLLFPFLIFFGKRLSFCFFQGLRAITIQPQTSASPSLRSLTRFDFSMIKPRFFKPSST